MTTSNSSRRTSGGAVARVARETKRTTSCGHAQARTSRGRRGLCARCRAFAEIASRLLQASRAAARVDEDRLAGELRRISASPLELLAIDPFALLAVLARNSTTTEMPLEGTAAAPAPRETAAARGVSDPPVRSQPTIVLETPHSDFIRRLDVVQGHRGGGDRW